MNQLQVDIQKKLKNFALQMEFSMGDHCLGILGASGCGKSMTLKAIAGIVTPDKGKINTEKTVFYDHCEKVNLSPQKRRVGYLFQNYALFPNMTVAGNIAAGIRGHESNQKKRIQELIEQFQLEGLENQYPGKLSGGQQQRTALARILASRPEILLLDEPFSAMDSYLKEELQLELQRHLQKFSGCTVIVSHDRDEVYRLCSHTMIMEEGRNLICKETKELFEEPEYRMAARLTGCKNISKAEKTGEKTLMALDWNVEFHVDKTLPEKLSYIGIRAHDFIPVGEGDAPEENCISVCPGEISKGPFEWNLLFQNAESLGGIMWMKQDRNISQIPDKVWVDSKKILFLK